MAPNAFNVLQFIVLLKNKEGGLFKMGETEDIMFWIYWSLLRECVFFGEKPFSEVVNSDDAEKSGWKRLE